MKTKSVRVGFVVILGAAISGARKREYRIAAIPGDGIGPEVIDAGLELLRALEDKSGEFRLQVERFPWGSDFYKKTARMMAENGLEVLRPFDEIFFGAVARRIFPTTLRFGACGLRCARDSIST